MTPSKNKQIEMWQLWKRFEDETGFQLQANQVQPEDEEEPEPKPKLSNKEIYENLKKRIKSVKESCGQVCDTTIQGEPGKYYQALKKEVNCEALFTNPDLDAEGEFQFPPKKIPKYLWVLKLRNFYLRLRLTLKTFFSTICSFNTWK